MDQTVGHGSHQCPRNLHRNFQHQLWVERTFPPHASFEGFALNQLHRVVAMTVIRRSTEVINGSNIRMPQSSRGAGFAQETFAHWV